MTMVELSKKYGVQGLQQECQLGHARLLSKKLGHLQHAQEEFSKGPFL
jgi:hypothetical protein